MKVRHQPEQAPALEFLKRVDDHHVSVRGELTFETVALSLGAVAELLRPGSVLRFDMSGIVRADSVAAALLVEWLRMAHKAGCDLRFSRVPVALQAIMDVASLGEILPMDSNDDSLESN